MRELRSRLPGEIRWVVRSLGQRGGSFRKPDKKRWVFPGLWVMSPMGFSWVGLICFLAVENNLFKHPI